MCSRMSKPMAVAVFVLISFVGDMSLATAAEFKITAKRDTDKVEVKVENEKTVFSIHSPVGISEATIERTKEKWPEAVILRLHLKLLENFVASNGNVTLHATVSNRDGKVRLWKDGNKDLALDAKSPYWMEVRMFGGDGKPVKEIPLKDGYFEMKLPKAFFEGNPKSITVNWIDFFRN